MRLASKIGCVVLGLALGTPLASPLATVVNAAPADVPNEVTYTKDIAPIIQRSCENCHRVDGVAPMPLSNYEQVRPWARAMKQSSPVMWSHSTISGSSATSLATVAIWPLVGRIRM